MPPSLVVANLYGLRLNKIIMLELSRCRRKIEGKLHHFWFVRI